MLTEKCASFTPCLSTRRLAIPTPGDCGHPGPDVSDPRARLTRHQASVGQQRLAADKDFRPYPRRDSSMNATDSTGPLCAGIGRVK